MSDLQKSHVIKDGPVDAEMDGLDGNADKEFSRGSRAIKGLQ